MLGRWLPSTVLNVRGNYWFGCSTVAAACLRGRHIRRFLLAFARDLASACLHRGRSLRRGGADKEVVGGGAERIEFLMTYEDAALLHARLADLLSAKPT